MGQRRKPLLSRKEKAIARLDGIRFYENQKSEEFRISLVRQYRTKGQLSQKQWFWVYELIKRAEE